MERSRTWLLISNHHDVSLLRNRIVYDMANYVGMAYTPECEFADLYMNGKYMGSYLLTEKIQVGDGRVEIDDLKKATEQLNDEPLSSYKMHGREISNGGGKYYDIPNDPDDITGGYLFCLEYSQRYSEMKSAVVTDRGLVFEVRSPSRLSKAQYKYLSSKVQSLENALFAHDGVDPETGKRWDELCDKDSMVLKFILEELSCNYDANYASQYFYKPADDVSDKIFAGPVWDYDNTFALGRQRTSDHEYPTGKEFYAAKQKGNYWWPACYKHTSFQKAVKETWKEKVRPALEVLLGKRTDPTGKLQSVQSYIRTLTASAAMNMVRWPMSDTEGKGPYHGDTWLANCTWLEKYIGIRYEWLDEQWGED